MSKKKFRIVRGPRGYSVERKGWFSWRPFGRYAPDGCGMGSFMTVWFETAHAAMEAAKKREAERAPVAVEVVWSGEL